MSKKYWAIGFNMLNEVKEFCKVGKIQVSTLEM